MPPPREIPLCTYRYDSLDRLIGHAQPNVPEQQIFYCQNRLSTEVMGAMQSAVMQHGNFLLAVQQQLLGECTITLLVTDQQRSVLKTLKPDKHIAYLPYGHYDDENVPTSMFGFNGERTDPVTRNYLLGNGYRAFSPVLMRFNTPDNFSPFGQGGINAYAYCLDDPVNRRDSSGASSIFSLIPDTFNLVRNRITKSYYKNAGKHRARAIEPLKNVDSSKRVVQGEDVTLKWNIKHGKTEIKTIKNKKDLEILNTPNKVNKYVLNKRNQLIIGSINDNMDEAIVPSHASIARHASTSDSMGNEVISAGYLIRADDGYLVTNHSGHYLPTPERTTITKFKLRGMGVKADSQNIDFS